jgi:Short C-terminal domain
MQRLTEQGQRIINDLANRYGVSNDAVMTMLDAVMKGNGTMAQFNHRDFGGAGQWMQGGMTMVGDMFNYALKSKVEGLCAELSNLIANLQTDLFKPMSSQSQSQGGQQQGGYGQVSLFVPGAGRQGNWWPAELGVPSSTGAQNNIKYAYFPSSCRLAVEINGHVTVYDTQDHQISGVSQQQSTDASLTFSSQYGLVRIENLPVISIDGGSPQPPLEAAPPDSNEAFRNAPKGDIFTQIEQLAELRKKDILTEDEFSAKKAELLKKL